MRKRISKDRRTYLNGFTLIEILVVMSLIVLIATIAWPSLRGSLQRSELESAAKQVSHDLSQMRLKAIESGVAQKFRYQPGKGVYELTPCPTGLLELHQELKEDSELMSGSSSEFESDTSLSPYGEEISASSGEDSLFEADKYEQITLAELPVGIAFSGVERRRAAEEEEVSTDMKDVWTDDEGWSRPVIFFPNGQSTGGQIFLEQRPGLSIDLQLRSLTGEATVGQIHKMKPEEFEAGDISGEETSLDSGADKGMKADRLLE
ncbi:MAG: prepilin-type N-terminal cleavage/methylation domain-containing protein [Planctomycetaceae bacterium]|nr:prepilin-type N-terminal cleavage/methylation domain-containing protein [Planctomycetaceae bacterium]